MKNFLQLILIPFVVGVAIVTYEVLIPKFLTDKPELAFKIEDPISYIDPSKVSTLEITVNGKSTKTIFSNQASIENTGKIPLKNIAVLFKFNDSDSSFMIYNYSYKTIPEYEFGGIEEQREKNSIKLTFELLNPKDKVFFNALTNKESRLTVFSKYENMNLYQASIQPANEGPNFMSIFLGVLVSVISTFAAAFVIRKNSALSKGLIELVNALTFVKPDKDLRIISALYGKGETYIEVKAELSKSIVDNSIDITVDNTIAGDPIPGTVKELKVIYTYGDAILTKVIPEGGILKIVNE